MLPEPDHAPGALALGGAPAIDPDASQRAVLDLPAGRHAAVFGGPGTGKTATIVELVAERVAAGLEPERILVLAATRQTATALRDGLAVRLGRATRGPLARTANSIAFQLVRGLEGEETRLLTGAEHDRLIDELLRGGLEGGAGPVWPERLGPEVRALRGFRGELRDLAMRAAEHGVRPAELAGLGRIAERPEWIAAAGFLAEYEEVKDLAKARRFDSAELLAYAAAIVQRSPSDPEAAAALGPLGELGLLLVDDAQEQTAGVAELLRGFAARGVQVIAFGDPDVAANGFRGGRAELLGSLDRVLGAPAERLELSVAHRGRPEIRGVLAGTASHIGTALGGRHRAPALSEAATERAAADALPPLLGIEAASHGAEVARIAELLREHRLLGGVPWSRMAVVLRSGGDVPGIERGLAMAEVPTAVAVAGQALRDAPAAAALLRAASLAIGREELAPELAVSLLTGPIGGLDAVGLRRLRLALRQEELAAGGDRPGDELLVDALGAPGGFETVDAHPARRAGRLAKTLDAARATAAGGGTVEEVLWAIWSGSGLAAEWAAQASGTGVLADEANRGLDAAVALFAAAQRFVELTPEAPAGRFLDEQLGADVPEDTLAPRAAGDAVLVATPAALVGRSFDIVVIAGLQEGTWPNPRPRGTLLQAELLPRTAAAVRAGEAPPAPDDARTARQAVQSDELRLFALAVSRAERQLVLSCTADDDEQPSKLFGFAGANRHGGRRRPLQLRGLVGALRAELAATGGGPASEAASALALLAEQGVPGAHPEEWYGLAEPSTERPLIDLDGDPEARVSVSPSQIERAEESPLGWFVDRVASPPSGIAASIGTIVHAVVEELGTREDADTSVEAVWEEVARRLESVPFEAGWVAARERRGARRMAEGASAYLGNFADDRKVLLGAEGRFTLETGRVRITGTIDRVERSADGTTVIVDLKTGRTPPSVKGMKQHAQLGAYQLAARAGAVAGRGADAAGEAIGGHDVIGGAKLVFVAVPSSKLAYTERVQQPFDEEEAQAFADRLDVVGRLMAGFRFESPASVDRNSTFKAWHYRVQLVPAVSA
ncbi:UrvD/REP family ATP-dependent DNA helicase [Agromyces archimandritae]|uniref:DNA 3'-5' helicase n=1 Tax=Agromyces archimandritae TaxID=2781962 RepID=A0A975FKN4_9MICO|nr:UrvD/REP family ATP-dependent DNA helicase [Agromyces archimandritae]QTX04278.1 ATP-dependent helicase [Agromyces archimandritae]